MTDAHPVYLVRGDDATLVGDEVRRLVKELVGDDDAGLAVEDLGGEEGDPGPVLDACLTPPFLSSRRVVVVRDVGRFTGEAPDRLVQYLDDPMPTTHLVLVAGGGRTAQKLLNAVKKAGAVVDTDVPTGRGRTTWLVERLRDAPVRLDAAAGNLLGEHLGEDLGRLGSLLDTLAGAYGPGSSVGVEELRPFLGEAGGVAPWDLTDAIDRGDTAAALGHLHRMLSAGKRHPLVVMATLHRHFQSVLRLQGSGVRSEADAARLLGLKGSTFPARKALAQADRLGWDGVSQAIALLADADLDLRGAAGWPDELVMEVLVARLCRLSRPARGGRAPRR